MFDKLVPLINLHIEILHNLSFLFFARTEDTIVDNLIGLYGILHNVERANGLYKTFLLLEEGIFESKV